jgi:hypothetical protein
MGEKDLAGFDDCDSRFTEIDTDTIEHVRHSVYWAVNTDRGQDWEEPSRWTSLLAFIEQTITAAAVAGAASAGTDLEETDARVQRAVYEVAPGETMRWSAVITTTSGAAFVEGHLQSLPQDARPEEEAELPLAGPVAAGVKTLRQVAVDGGLFPDWITGPNSGKIVYSIALLFDMATEWLVQGIQQRFPLVCHEGALPWLSRDLGVRRGYRETSDAFRQRLRLWIPSWRRAGVPFAIAQQAQAYFSPQAPRVHVVQHDPGADGKPTRATWSTRNPDGSETVTVVTPSNFDYDSEDSARPESLATRDPRVWVLVEQPPSDTSGLFSVRTSAAAATRDPGGMNGAVRPDGGTAPSDHYRDLVSIAEDWRAMGTWVAGVIVVFGQISTGGAGSAYPDGRWFDYLNDAGDGARIPSTLRLLYVNRYPGERLPDSPAPYEV